MPARRAPHVASLFVLLAPVVCLAQSDQVAVHGPIDATTLWSGGIERSATGDYNGDWLPDVVNLYSGYPHVLYGAGVYDAVYPAEPGLTESVNDIATAKQWTGGHDTLITLGGHGLAEWVYESAAGSFARVTIDGIDSQAGAELRIADLDLDGAEEILALVPGRAGLIRFERTPSGTWSRLSDIPWVVSNPVDFEVIEFNGCDLPELAVMSATEVFVQTVAGSTPVYSFINGHTMVDLAVVEHQGRAPQQLAIVSHNGSSGLDYLSVAGYHDVNCAWTSSPTIQVESLFALIDVQNITATDLDLDGDSDLAVCHTWNGDQLIFLGTSKESASSTSYAITPESVIVTSLANYGTSFENHKSRPDYVDVDHDGDVDILLGVQPTGEEWVAFNGVIAQSDRRVLPSDTLDIHLSEQYDEDGELISHQLLIPLARPAVVSESVRYIEVLPWFSAVENGVPSPVQFLSAAHLVVDVGSGWTAASTVWVSIPVDQSDKGFDDFYHLVVRMVGVDDTTNLYNAASVATVLTYTTDSDVLEGFDQEWIVYGESPVPQKYSAILTDGNDTPKGEMVGGVAVRPNLDPFDPMMPPPAPMGPPPGMGSGM